MGGEIEMFEYTQKELDNALTGYFISDIPLRLRQFPSKQKRKYLVLLYILRLFDDESEYTESEVNDILEPVYADFVTLRRALVDYKLLSRTKNGSKYWVSIK